MPQKITELRFDGDIEGQVLEALQQSGMPELKRLTVEIEFDQVILEGEVRTYYAKQIAQSLVGKVDGVDAVKNNISVIRTESLYATR